MIHYIQRISYFIVLVTGLLLSSCGNMNRMAYLTDVKDSTELDSLQIYDLVIEPGMQLNIYGGVGTWIKCTAKMED